MKAETNIFPFLDQIVQRSQKEAFLKQRAKVIWLTGLSGSGKTTIAVALEKKLFAQGFLTQILDGDNIRYGINNNLRFTEEDRIENIRRIAEVTKLFFECGIICLNCFVSPTQDIRHRAAEIIGAENIFEVYINAPLAVCEKRDAKGLYKKARNGEIPNFTGISSPYEIPESANLEIRTDLLTIEQSVDKLFNSIISEIEYKNTDK